LARDRKSLARGAAAFAALSALVLLPARAAGGLVRPARFPTVTARLVRIHVFGAPDDVTDAAPAAVVARARRGLTAANCTNPGSGTSAYSLSGSRVNGPTTAHFYAGRVPGSVHDPEGAFRAAFSAWQAADSAAPTISVVADGTTARPTANHRYDLMFKRLGGRTLAVTYTWRWSTGDYESDTAFNTQARWFQAAGEGDGCYEGTNGFDLQNTATHEFGHVSMASPM
jgi:hypothetical protein